MAAAIVEKVAQNESFRQKLLAIPKGDLIVEHTSNDSTWGDGSSDPQLGNGENRLGLLLMTLRNILEQDINALRVVAP